MCQESTIKGKKLVRTAQLPFIVYGESSRLHVSTPHAGHLQAFTKKMSP